MLENAGATVFSPRERDWQPNEIIIDNDDDRKAPYYIEINTSPRWTDAGASGFSNAGTSTIYGSDNPFYTGTTRMAKASKTPTCTISYQPEFKESGEYAVYVSYPDIRKNVDDAEYTVYHKGKASVFHINQQMGGGTWVYLGTFNFEAGCSSRNRVVLTNKSDNNGYVTADAVRLAAAWEIYAVTDRQAVCQDVWKVPDTTLNGLELPTAYTTPNRVPTTIKTISMHAPE